MRAYYLIKALQIMMAVVGIYRLLSVDELCEIRNAESLSSCVLAMRLSLSHSGSEFNREASMALRSIRRRNDLSEDTILVTRDRSLEEIHARNLRSGMLPKMAQYTDSLPESVTEQVDTIKNSVAYEMTTTEIPSTTNNTKFSSTVSSTEKSFHSGKIESVKNNVSIAVTSERSPDLVEITMSTESESTRIDNKDQAYVFPSSKDTVLEKSMQLPTKKIRLVNRVQNCLPVGQVVQCYFDLFPINFHAQTGVHSVLGFDDNDLPYIAAIRLPIICQLLSIIGVIFSIIHVLMNLSKPRRCRIFTECIIQIVLWSLSGIALLLVRQDWEMLWNGTKPGAFLPEYPSSWHCEEICCYVMVVIYIAEFYFYDYIFYKIYFEESYGSYTVVERPEYDNSIYMSTVEMIDDTAL
ncbi:hypothetical protein DICVIV_02775 [Dictyocaulus viviparus]|uniref:Uncharacterized protein n=1 Tax=Dictyocaulus viviparus TaxID=29172 RepID=A0A0D8Y2K1_DICVI|nr:hypothetical protein DICVIV_02775 [Dictyocaulus viviparus]